MPDAVPQEVIQRILLQLPNRRRIYDTIQATPGTHARALARDLDLALGTVEHHLRQLQKHDLVFTYSAGRRRTVYATGCIDARDAPFWHTLRTPVCARLVTGLLERERSVSHLAAQVGIGRTTASHHLGRMHQAELLHRLRVGRETIYMLRHRERFQAVLRALGREGADKPDRSFIGIVARAMRMQPARRTAPERAPRLLEPV